MILWRIWRWLFGWVRLEAEGGLCERFLNLLSHEPISLWDIRRKGDRLYACCPARQYRLLRPFARRTGTRLHICRKSGLPFWLHGMRKRKGLAAGAVLAAALYVLLAGRIWVIEIHADGDPSVTPSIAAKLPDLGVAIGQKRDDVDIAALRMNAIAQIEEINWMSVHFEGHIAHIEASVQKQSVPLDNSDTPSNLIAAYDGQIVSMQVTSGQALVRTGEGVVKGDLLVCGAVETTNGTLLHRASGIVLARTEHSFSVRVPFCEELPMETGTVWTKSSLWAFGLTLPLYTDVPAPSECIQSEQTLSLCLRGVELPIGLRQTRIIHRTAQQVTHTAEEAAALAAQRLQAIVESELACAVIDSSELSAEQTADAYILHGVYRCTENIAREQPMLLTDAE